MVDEMADYWLQRAREELAERYPNQHPAILQLFELAWSVWECDSRGALITLEGVPEIVVLDGVNSGGRPPVPILAERIEAYRKLIEQTEAVLRQYRELGGKE